MSYCVHCGVELGAGEKKCPLCATPVLDPNELNARPSETYPAFPNKMDIPRGKLNYRFLALLISVLLFIPLAVVVVIDLMTSSGLTWSLYVLGSDACLWAFVVLPLHFPNKKPYLYVGVDIVTMGCFAALICFANDSMPVFYDLIMPMMFIVFAVSLVSMLIWRRVQWTKIERLGWLIILASIFLCTIDLTIIHFAEGLYRLSWAWYASIPLLALGIAVVIMSHSAVISDWIRKRLFI